MNKTHEKMMKVTAMLQVFVMVFSISLIPIYADDLEPCNYTNSKGKEKVWSFEYCLANDIIFFEGADYYAGLLSSTGKLYFLHSWSAYEWLYG